MRQTYDEVSPITGNRRVLVEYDEERQANMKLCMETGYHTYDTWVSGSDIVRNVESELPDIIRKSAVIDSSGHPWYKLILMTPFLLLIPELVNDTDEAWVIYALKWAEDGDDVIMVVPGDDGEDRYRTIDPNTRQEFPANKFSEAMDVMQTLGAAIYEKLKELSDSKNGDGDE